MFEFGGTDRFQVLSCLGRGGMGIVYEALDRDSDRRVAIKTLQLSGPELLLRLKNEFRALQGIHHHNLIQLGELIEHDGTWFFTMELVEGTDFVDHVRPSTGRAEPLAYESTAADGGAAALATLDAEPPRAGGRGGALDEPRLRRAARQLAESLAALHAAGKIHRDIKPSNVLVTGDDRVVVLDFGLVTDALSAHRSMPGLAVGTAAYMSPEQAAAASVGPPTDWYGVGAMMYEALTGRLPFSGAPFDVMVRKQRETPPSPSRLGARVPDDLEQLCMALLRIAPDQRPGAAEVLARLGADTPATTVSATGSRDSALIGRETELGQLAAAFDDARAGRGVTFVVHGVAGVGKTALIRRFLDTLPPEVVVLDGRCFERESVPFKGFDGIVDALARYLATVPPPELGPLLPQEAGFVAKVFPVLRRAYALARSDDVPRAELDPREQRARMFTGLRGILRNIGRAHPTVVVIEDMQWSDRDSLDLLGELMREPNAPPLLLVVSATFGSGARRVLERTAEYTALVRGDVRMVNVEPLPPAQAKELAASLLDRAGATADAAALAAEAEGHPLFIEELVRFTAERGAAAGGRAELDAAIWARAGALGAAPRAVIELVAVAGAPVPLAAVATAAGLPADELTRVIGQLRSAQLARSTGARTDDRLEVSHGHVRRAVLAHLAMHRRKHWHGALAVALEAFGTADLEQVSHHYHQALHIDKAAVFAVRAAEQAAGALAFDRAATLYQRAIELSEITRSHGRRQPPELARAHLRIALGQAQANAGYGDRAAETFLAAAGDADPAHRLELRRRAAEELLQFGHIDRGMDELAEVLRAVGSDMPASPRRALAGLLWRRARSRVRGLRFRDRAEAEIPGTELARVDVFWTAAKAVGLADFILGATFQTKHLLLALRAGEPTRVARALCLEAAYLAGGGSRARARAQRVLDRADALRARVDDPAVLGLITGARGLADHFVGEFAASLDHLRRAERVYRDECVGVEWELGIARLFSLQSLLYLGRLRELRTELSRALRQAAERRDLHALTHYRSGFLNLAWLIADDAVNARLHADDAVARWSGRRFTAQHFFDLSAKLNIDLYLGDGPRAYQRAVEARPAVDRSLLLRVEFLAIAAHDLYGRAAVAAAARSALRDRDQLTTARHHARALARTPFPWSRAMGRVIEGAAAAVDGDDAAAAAALRDAAAVFAARDMQLHHHAVRWRLGALGDAAARATALAYAARECIRAPDRLFGVFAPG